jgi:hypothetical protein
MRDLGKSAINFSIAGRGVVAIYAKQDFVVGIILAAEAGVVFIGVDVQTFDWFQAADGRGEIWLLGACEPRAGVEPDGAIDG